MDYRLERSNDLIKAIQHYIQQHYMEELTLKSLADKVHLSPSYLSKLFKRETGENLSIYIQNVRIQHAKILLCTTDLKTYEVAERVGISDPVYFSRTFKKVRDEAQSFSPCGGDLRAGFAIWYGGLTE